MSTPVVRVRDLELRRGARVVLDAVSLDVYSGEILMLMGASGSGKTTMLRAVAGLEQFDRGEVDVDGVSLRHGEPDAFVLRALRTKVGMVFQSHCLFDISGSSQLDRSGPGINIFDARRRYLIYQRTGCIGLYRVLDLLLQHRDAVAGCIKLGRQ